LNEKRYNALLHESGVFYYFDRIQDKKTKYHTTWLKEGCRVPRPVIDISMDMEF